MIEDMYKAPTKRYNWYFLLPREVAQDLVLGA